MYAGGVNFTSLIFINVYRIYILLVWFDEKGENYFWVYLCPFVDDLTKRGRGILEFYICMIISFHCFIQKGEEEFWAYIYACYFSIGIRAHIFCLCKKGRSIYVYFLIFAYMCYLVYAYHWISLLFIAMYELKGELLLSLTLIHAYITPWALSSSKRGRLLA